MSAITSSNTVEDPRAMVVHFQDASSTYTAVVGSWSEIRKVQIRDERFEDFANLTPSKTCLSSSSFCRLIPLRHSSGIGLYNKVVCQPCQSQKQVKGQKSNV